MTKQKQQSYICDWCDKPVRSVPNQEEAKCRASKIFFDHLFTGTFKYMKATRINR